MVVLLDKAREAFALEVDRVEADVDQELGAVVEAQADGMVAFRHDHRDFRVGRRDDRVRRRLDGDAVAHHFLREHLIGDFAHVDELAADAGFDAHSKRLVGRRGSGRCSGCRLFGECGDVAFQQRVEVAAHLRDVHADDDLDGVAVLDEAVRAGFRELARRADLVGVCDRDAEARRAVRDFFDVRRAAEAVEVDARLDGELVAGEAHLFHFFLRLVLGFGEQFVLDVIGRAARRRVVVLQDEETEHEEVNEEERDADDDLHDVRAGMILEQGDPVLHEAVDEAAAEVAGQAKGIERRGERRREDGMCCIEERRDEEERELDRLRDAAEDSGQRGRDEERGRLFLLFRTCAHVHGEGCTRQAPDFRRTVEGEAAFREELAQALRARGEVLKMLQPVGLDAAVADGRAEDEREIDEMMEAGRQEDAFGERVAPDTDEAGRLEEELELLDDVLDGRPDEAEDECHRNHDGEADGHDERRAFEDAEPLRDLGIVEPIVQVCAHASDEDRAEHAHVERLDVRDHREARAGTGLGAVVDAEEVAVQREERRDEVVEHHVDHERFHGGAARLLLREADRHGDGEEDRHLREDGPAALLYDIPEIIPDSSLICNRAQEHRILADDGNCNRKTKECKQDDRRVHRAAKPLQFLHNAVL